jgi:hypothetical protein
MHNNNLHLVLTPVLTTIMTLSESLTVRENTPRRAGLHRNGPSGNADVASQLHENPVIMNPS